MPWTHQLRHPHPHTLSGEVLTLNTFGLVEGKHHLKIESRDQRGIDAELFAAPFWVEERSHRWSQGVMYQVVNDRFSPPLPSTPTNAEENPTLKEGSPSIAQRWGGD